MVLGTLTSMQIPFLQLLVGIITAAAVPFGDAFHTPEAEKGSVLSGCAPFGVRRVEPMPPQLPLHLRIAALLEIAWCLSTEVSEAG